MSDSVTIKGMRVPFDVGQAENFGFRRKNTNMRFTPQDRQPGPYTKRCAEVGPGCLRDASMNRFGYVEAGYCVGNDEGDGTNWFISNERAPEA